VLSPIDPPRTHQMAASFCIGGSLQVIVAAKIP
jgi:hypothetical protein